MFDNVENNSMSSQLQNGDYVVDNEEDEDYEPRSRSRREEGFWQRRSEW